MVGRGVAAAKSAAGGRAASETAAGALLELRLHGRLARGYPLAHLLAEDLAGLFVEPC